MVQIIIAVAITAVVAVIITYMVSQKRFQKNTDEKIGVRRIVREPLLMRL